MDINTFLVKAKKSTYASGKPPQKMADGFEEFTYEEENYKYKDKYHAKDPKPFGGEEIVWQNGKAVWIMNYYGFILSNEVDSKAVYEFLRKAMSLVNKEKPFRGPSNLKEEDFEYKNNVEGNISNFKGTERILFKDKEVYRLEYPGGKL